MIAICNSPGLSPRHFASCNYMVCEGVKPSRPTIFGSRTMYEKYSDALYAIENPIIGLEYWVQLATKAAELSSGFWASCTLICLANIV